MELEKMTVEELEARKNAIGTEKDTDGADLDALLEEIRNINAELEKRKATETAKEEIRNAVAQGEGEVIKTLKQEERKMFELDSKEYRNAWLKSLQGKPLTEEERSGYTQTSSHAIPTLVSDKMFEKMKKLAPMLSEITLLRMAGNINFVVEGTRNSASAHTENAEISVSDDTTVSVSLGAVEFFKIIGISESARAMAIDAFENWLVELLAGDIARAIDDYIINGGSYGIADITFTTGTNQILNTGSYTLKNLLDLDALLPAAYDAEAKWLVNKKVLYEKIANITYSSGQSVFIPDAREGFGKILGREVLVDDYVSTANGALYLGKWTDVVGNLSQDINVITYPDYDHAQVKFRGGAFFDSKVAKTDGIVRLVSTTN